MRGGVAVCAAGIALALQMLFWPYLPPSSPQLFFYPAVFAAARVAGTGAGYAASVLSATAMAYTSLPPHGSFGVDRAADLLDLGIFVGVSCVMSATLGRLRLAVVREREAARAAMNARAETDASWSMVAHDLRTPLASILLAAELLEQRLRRDAATAASDLERSASVIHRASERASRLVDDVLDAMKLSEGTMLVRPSAVDVRPLFTSVADAVAVVADKAGVRIEVEVSTSRRVLCDERRLAQVLTNLLVNAIRFSPAGGRVWLRADDVGAKVRLTVRDVGRGIAPQDLTSLFTRHWTKESGGRGLGLWIARGIVEAHGSELRVESHEGHGARFWFDLDVAGASVD